MSRRVASLAIALLLVTSIVPTGIVASSAPTSTDSTNTPGDDPACEAIDAMTFIYGFDCTASYTAEQISDHTDLYVMAANEESSNEAFLDLFHNYRQDMDPRAWMLAEATVAEEYKNGSTQVEAEVATRDEVGEYYSLNQKNMLDKWNSSVSALEYMYTERDNNSLDNVFHHNVETSNSRDNYNLNHRGTTYEGVEPTSIELANGTTTTVLALNFTITVYNVDNNGYGNEYDRTMLLTPDNYVRTDNDQRSVSSTRRSISRRTRT